MKSSYYRTRGLLTPTLPRPYLSSNDAHNTQDLDENLTCHLKRLQLEKVNYIGVHCAIPISMKDLNKTYCNVILRPINCMQVALKNLVYYIKLSRYFLDFIKIIVGHESFPSPKKGQYPLLHIPLPGLFLISISYQTIAYRRLDLVRLCPDRLKAIV